MKDLDRIRQIIEGVYVRDMYRVRDRGTLSPEFHEAFRVLVPRLNGRTRLCDSVSWEPSEVLRGSNPKALEATTRSIAWMVSGESCQSCLTHILTGLSRVDPL